MKKWIFILIALFLLAAFGKAWSSGMFGFMYPPSFHTIAPATGDKVLMESGDYLLLEAGDKIVYE
jgi:hypothetical protein